MAILRRIFFRISFSNFWFLSLLLARSRRVLANLEERIEKFIDAAFFWPVENVPDTQRARARARARPSCSTGASGPFDDRRLRSTTFRARATFKKYILSLGSFFYFCVNYILFCLNCVQMFYNLFNFSRVFNLTLCVPPAKLRNLEKRRARAPLFEFLVRSPGVVQWWSPIIFYRFTAIRGKLRVSEVCSNKLKFSPLQGVTLQ